jgi:hypothetical protein
MFTNVRAFSTEPLHFPPGPGVRSGDANRTALKFRHLATVSGDLIACLRI